jgi:serine/threonine-protein kinase HipA
MRKATVKIHDIKAGILTENSPNHFVFQYDIDYNGQPISLIMLVSDKPYEFDSFPPFFDGLLPEGIQLEGLLKKHKIDKTDYFSQLLITGQDLVGAVTVEKFNPENE